MYRNREMDNLHDILKGIPFEERKEDIKEVKDYGYNQFKCLRCGYIQKIPFYSGETKLCPKCKVQMVPSRSPRLAQQMKKKYGKDYESKQTNEQLPRHHSASQTMKPEEKPDIDAEDHHLEDYSEEDLEKAKDKGKETGHTLTEPKEDELKVEPKKESKLKEGRGEEIYQEALEFAKKELLKQLRFRLPYDEFVIRRQLSVKFGISEEEAEGIIYDAASPDELDLGHQPNFESKRTKKRNQLYLCNECFKTFRANESVCTHCQSEKVEKITLQEQDVAIFKHVYKVDFEDKDGEKGSTRVEAYDEADAKKVAKESKVDIEKITKVKKIGEGKDNPGERDGTGPVKGSDQRKKYGDKGKRKQAGEKCSYEEEISESKLYETVQELVGEVDGIDRIDQHLLNKAIEDGVIPNQFPELDAMIDQLSAADVAKELGVKDIDDVDLGDIDAVYLKYILLPKAKEASRVARESKVNEDERDEFHKGYDYAQLTDEAHLDLRAVLDLIKPHSSEEFRRGYTQYLEENPEDESKNETLTPEQIKNLKAPKLKFDYGTVVEHNQIMEDLAKTDFFENVMVGTQITLVDAKGVPVIYAKDDDKQWKEFSSLGFVEEAKEMKSLTAVEIVKSSVDPEVWNVRIVELPEGSTVTAASTPDKDKAKKYAKDFATSLNAKYVGFVEESKLKEQEEDSFKTVARGIEDKDTADKLAKEKEGQVVADEEDEKKFSVIVREK